MQSQINNKVNQINSKNNQYNSYLNQYNNLGNSINVINAINAAEKSGLDVIIFTGKEGGKMNHFDFLTLKIESGNVARIQECHILVGHIVSKYLEENISLL